MDIVSGIVIGYSSAFGAAIVVYCYTEIKNYITVNVCDVNSTNKDILFYLSYLPHSEQQTIYHKVTQFSKTI